MLDQLAADLNTPVRRDDVVLQVPERPTVQLRFDVNIDHDQRKLWREQAKERKGNRSARRSAAILTGGDDEVDGLAFSCLIIATSAGLCCATGRPRQSTGAR